MKAELVAAGFTDVVRCEMGRSNHPELTGLDQRTEQSTGQMAVAATR